MRRKASITQFLLSAIFIFVVIGLFAINNNINNNTIIRNQTTLPNDVNNYRPLKNTNSKKKNNSRTEYDYIVPSNQRSYGGAFVHVGKTGGSTLSLLLRNGCHSYMVHPCRNITYETKLSQLITSYYHTPDFGLLRQSDHNFYIITCRDPYERTISAFTYEHIENRIARGEYNITIMNQKKNQFQHQKYIDAYKCFPSLEDFVQYFHIDDDTTDNIKVYNYPYHRAMVVADNCQDLARAALFGKVKIYNHLYFSYERIQSFIPNIDNHIIYIIRQNHLWDDWKNININYFYQTTPVYIPTNNDIDDNNKKNTTILEEYILQRKLPITRTISTIGTKYLCHALIDEYKAYYWFLQHAKNLNKYDIQDAINVSKRNCPDLKIFFESILLS